MRDANSAIAMLHLGVLLAAAFMLSIAALNDIATRTIPDLAPIGLSVMGAVVRVAEGNVASAFVASAAVLLFGALCWRCGWLGGGDVKLLAACAWLVPPALVPQLVLLTAIAGGVLAGIYLLLGKVARASHIPKRDAHPRSLAGRIWRTELWRIQRRATLPYGCAIAAATLLTLSGR
jgi:prepilin peptidase CpaA